MRFTNIQVVRIVAAVAVVLAHLGDYGHHVFHTAAFPVGELRTGSWRVFPVPVFFAVSGFVLTHAIQTARPGRFLLARAVRLYPGYWVATLLALGLIAFTVWPPGASHPDILRWVGWTLRPREFGSCVYVLGIEWSLVYEVVLYLCLVAMSLLGVRRGLPLATVAWLAGLLVKAAVWPAGKLVPLPTWGEVFGSAVNVPFLLGVLTYYARDTGRRWRWAAAAGLVAYLAVVPARFTTFEGQWIAYSGAAALTVWVVVQLRQIRADHPLVAAGEYTYGLYLAHVTLLIGTFYLLRSAGWLLDSTAGVLVAGTVALGLGALFGRAEAWLHGKLRPLAKLTAADLRAWPRRLRVRVGRLLPGRA